MQREEIIKQLENITVDQSEYNKKNYYYGFIKARNDYLSLSENLSPSEETKLLFDMLNSLTKWIFIKNKKNEGRYNPFLSQRLSARRNAIMETAPKIIHFICLSKITDIQRDYINLWIQNNPDYLIKLWADRDAILAQELSIRLQKQASREVLGDTQQSFAKILFQWQDRFYHYFLANSNKNTEGKSALCFDECVINFCIEQGLGERAELTDCRDANKNHLIETWDYLKKINPAVKANISFLYRSSHYTNDTYYLRELALRGHLAAASDILALNILNNYGGIYLTTDLLPAINSHLFAHLIQATPEDPQGTQSKAIIARLILDELGKDAVMPGRTIKLVQSYQHDDLGQATEAAIQEVIEKSKQQDIPLFIGLGDVKIDAYFQFSYADSNVRALAAQKGSEVEGKKGNPFITQLLQNLAKAYDIIWQYHLHDGKTLKCASIQEKIVSVKAALQSSGLQIKAKALMHYRWDILSQAEPATSALLATPAYNAVYAQQLKGILTRVSDKEGKELLPTSIYFFQKYFTPSFQAATFLTEEAAQSRLMGSMRYLAPLSNQPQYAGLYIIQLVDDLITQKAAQFLYHQNADNSDWYRYDAANNRLIYRSGTAVGSTANLASGKNIFLIGNAKPITLLSTLKIIELLKSTLLVHRTTLEQVNLLACQPIMAGESSNRLSIKAFFHAFEHSVPKIQLKRIVVQEHLFTVDMMGRKWKGALPAVKAAPLVEETNIHWSLSTENDTETLASKAAAGATVSYLTLPLGESMLMHHKVITPLNKKSFGLGSVIEMPIIHPEKRPEWMNSPEKLDGWLDKNTAAEILKKGQNGVVIMAAESMVLIAAMGDLTHELIISDVNLAKIAVLMTALQQSLEAENYADWFADLDFACGEKQFNQLVNALFATPFALQQAFKRLQSRVRGKRFTFFNQHFTHNGSAALIGKEMKSRAAISSVFLGSIEDALLFDIEADESTQLKQVTDSIQNIEAHCGQLNHLPKNNPLPRHSSFRLYEYSLLDGKANLQQHGHAENPDRENTQTFLQKEYANINYIQRAGQLIWSKGFNASIRSADKYAHTQAWKRTNHNILKQDQRLAAGEWLPLLSQLKYDPIDANYTITYLNTHNQNIIDVTTKNSIFAEMRQQADKYLDITKKNYLFSENKRQQPKLVGNFAGAGGLSNIPGSIESLFDFLTEGSLVIEGDSILRKAMQLHVFVCLASDFTNVLNIIPTVTTGTYRFLDACIEMGIFEKYRNPINNYWNVFYKISKSNQMKALDFITTEAALAISFTSFLFNAYEYHNAEDYRQSSLALTRVGFDVVGITFDVMSTKYLSIAQGFPEMMAVIAAGYGLSETSKALTSSIELMVDNITQARLAGMYFNHLKQGFEQGGFTLIGNVLIPWQGAVIKAIHLENARAPTVVFDEIGAQIRKKTAQGEDYFTHADDPEAYINLRELNEIEKDQIVAIAHVPTPDAPGKTAASNILMLPTSPRVKIDPIYGQTDLIKWRGDAEFDAVRYFAKKDPHFIFSFYKNASFLDPMNNAVGLGWMAMTGLTYRYPATKTDVNVYLGNDHFNLIAPGIQKKQKTSDSLYKKHLHYILHAPEQGKGSVFLLLNRGQADVTIACNNPNVQWVISTDHEHLTAMEVEKTPSGYRIFKNLPDNFDETESICLNVTQRVNTKLIFHMASGIGIADRNGNIMINEIDADHILLSLDNETIDFHDPTELMRSLNPALITPEVVKAYFREVIIATVRNIAIEDIKKMTEKITKMVKAVTLMKKSTDYAAALQALQSLSEVTDITTMLTEMQSITEIQSDKGKGVVVKIVANMAEEIQTTKSNKVMHLIQLLQSSPEMTAFPLYSYVKNFTLRGDEENKNVYYSLRTQDFVRTENQQDTLFANTQRRHVETLFFDETHAWFKGDLLLSMPDDNQHLYTYRNLIWVSAVESKKLIQVYFPICHQPDVLEVQNKGEGIQENIKHQSRSKITRITDQKNIERFIFFEQEYSYQRQGIEQRFILKYKIDTLKPEQGVIFTRALSLPSTIKNRLITDLNLDFLSHFMQQYSTLKPITLPLDKLNPWTRRALNIKAIHNFSTDTVIMISNQLIWPLMGTIVAKGIINVNLPMSISNNSTDTINHAGTTMVAINENLITGSKQQTNTLYYHFWSIADREQKFKKLYVQQDNMPATEMDLRHFGLGKDKVLSIKNTIINTANGLIYGLYDDQSISFVGVGKNWLTDHGDWWIYFKSYIDQLTKRVEGLTSLPAGQINPINIAPYLTISGLLDNDGLKPLAAWYDRSSQQFIFCQRDFSADNFSTNNSSQQLNYLGIDSNTQKNAWIMDIKNEKNKEIGYVDSVALDEVGAFFHKIVLKKTGLSRLKRVLNRQSGNPLSFTQVSTEENGYLKATTTEGLLLQIKKANGFFDMSLLGITLPFIATQTVNTAEIKQQIKNIIQYYHYPELLRVQIEKNIQGWYHTKKDKLFMPAEVNEWGIKTIYNLDHYLGFNNQTHCAYFTNNDENNANLIKINQNEEIENILLKKGRLYQRTNSLLILDSDTATQLADDEYVNVDVPALLITTPFDQPKNASFTFQAEKFRYPVIYLEHGNAGTLRCIMPAGSQPESLFISRKFKFLCLFVKNNLFVVNHSFVPTDDNASQRLQLVFEGLEMPVQGLSKHYIAIPRDPLVTDDSAVIDVIISIHQLVKYYIEQASAETRDGHVIIPLPRLSPVVA